MTDRYTQASASPDDVERKYEKNSSLDLEQRNGRYIHLRYHAPALNGNVMDSCRQGREERKRATGMLMPGMAGAVQNENAGHNSSPQLSGPSRGALTGPGQPTTARRQPPSSLGHIRGLQRPLVIVAPVAGRAGWAGGFARRQSSPPSAQVWSGTYGSSFGRSE